MRLHAIRLERGQDLKQSVTGFVTEQGLSSAAVVSAVGSLTAACLRMAGAEPDTQDVRSFDGHYEIVSLIGTIARDGSAHLHMAISDPEGRVVGGHVKEGCVIDTTAELVIASDDSLEFTRTPDGATGFDELAVKRLDG